MRLNLPHHKLALGVCLTFVHLMTLNVASASGKLAALDTYDSTSTQSQNMLSPKMNNSGPRRMFIYEQPARGGLHLNVDSGVNNSEIRVGTFLTSSKAKSDSIVTNISAGYGITDNFYTAVSLSHQTGKHTQHVIEFGEDSIPEYTTKFEGLDEPAVLLGSQFTLNQAQIFAELKMDIKVGDRTEHSDTRTEASRNVLKGGSSYTPQVSFSHDAGDVIIGGKVSYTISDKKVTRYEASSAEETGGNKVEVLGAIEFQYLSKLGFLAGYILQENRQTTIRDNGDSYTSDFPGLNYATLGSYCVFDIDKTTSLIPKISYATTLNKTYVSSGNIINVESLDVWNLSLGARFNF